MDFLTTARLLMDIQREHTDMTYRFETNVGDTVPHVIISLPVEENVPALFDSAAKMFEEVYE